MGKLPMGRPNPHIQKSNGADSDLMKFYTTQYSSTYSKKFSKFQPQQGHHTGTGYLSNFRPAVYYNEKLDQIDNPTMGAIVRDNYHTITENSFRPYTGLNGGEILPSSCKQKGSGFIREKALTIPTYCDARNVLIDTRVASAPAEIMPHHKPLLHKLKRKDPVELENSGYGPGYMTTETQERFRGAQPHLDVGRRSIGPKEGSGFTHAYNIEPVTYHPKYSHKGDIPAYLTDRPTGVSIMKTAFYPSEYSDGSDPLPRIAKRSDHESGFTNANKPKPEFVHRIPGDAYDKASDIPAARLDKIKKKDPAEYQNCIHPNNQSSVTKATFKGEQFPAQTEADRLGRTTVSHKEETGYTDNNDRFVQTADNPSRFITHYMTKFTDRTPQGIDRMGHTWGGVQPQKTDGFTRSTGVHKQGPSYDSTSIMRNLEPYVARSIRTRDTFFDDHTHDSKLQSNMAKCAISA